MIEYFSTVYTALLLSMTVAVCLLRTERLDLTKISDGIESFKNALDFIGSLPQWIHFYNNLNANVQTLQQRRDGLQVRLDDLIALVEDKEFQTGRRRKREVDNWMTFAETKCSEVQTLLQGMSRETNHFWKFLHRAWLGNLVERLIREVDDLYSSGVFEEVLSPVRERVKLLETLLVGKAAEENSRRIITWLRNGVTKIGVHGIKGIGKSAAMKNIHNKLLSEYSHVYFITVPEDPIEYILQDAIAKVLGIDLQEDDLPKRAALLHRALRQRKNFVLILDGLKKYISEDKVGIPLGAETGKMIITSRSPDVCRKTGCQNYIIPIDPLSDDEALDLFKQFQQANDLEPSIEKVARRIVKQCRGVPLKIVDQATNLRGEDDINAWENSLSEMLKE